MAAITISDGKVIEGALPGKALEMVKEWVSLHKEELHLMWENQEFKQISAFEELKDSNLFSM